MPGLSNKGRGYGLSPPFLSLFVVIGSPAKGVKPHRGQDDSLEHSLNETVVVLSLSLAPAITARYDQTSLEQSLRSRHLSQLKDQSPWWLVQRLSWRDIGPRTGRILSLPQPSEISSDCGRNAIRPRNLFEPVSQRPHSMQGLPTTAFGR